MKSISLFILSAGALALQGLTCGSCNAGGAADQPLTLRVMPERDLLYARDSGKTVVQVDLEGRCPKRDVRSPMNVVVVLDGLDDCDRIFSILHSAGFDSRISIEDGMEDLRESVQFLRGKIDRQFT